MPQVLVVPVDLAVAWQSVADPVVRLDSDRAVVLVAREDPDPVQVALAAGREDLVVFPAVRVVPLVQEDAAEEEAAEGPRKVEHLIPRKLLKSCSKSRLAAVRPTQPNWASCFASFKEAVVAHHRIGSGWRTPALSGTGGRISGLSIPAWRSLASTTMSGTHETIPLLGPVWTSLRTRTHATG